MDIEELAQRLEALEAVVIGQTAAINVTVQALTMAVPQHAAPIIGSFLAEQRRAVFATLPSGADRYFEAHMDTVQETLRQL